MKSLNSVCFGCPHTHQRCVADGYNVITGWRQAGFQENYIGLTYFSQSEFACQLNLPHVVVSIALGNGYVGL